MFWFLKIVREEVFLVFDKEFKLHFLIFLMIIKIILVIPVYNEEKILENSIKKLYNYMRNNIKGDWQIIIANNASTDNTEKIAEQLSKKLNFSILYLKGLPFPKYLEIKDRYPPSRKTRVNSILKHQATLSDHLGLC